jgi:protease-4
MNTISKLKQSLDNNVWAISPADFISFKNHIEGIKSDISTVNTLDLSGNDNDDDSIDESGRTIININGVLVRGTGLDSDICDFLGITDLDNLDNELIQARDNEDVKTILLLINSPGGTAHAHSTALLIQQIAQDKDVIGFSNAMCCSAAYELASQCSEFYVSETAWIGFVGTIFTRADNTNANNQDGVSYTFVTSSPKKLYLNPNTSITKEEQAWIESVVMYGYNIFKNDVLANRKIDEQYLDSSIFIGEQAVELNFADGIINNLDDLNKKTSAVS